jgi:hypothetical protein
MGRKTLRILCFGDSLTSGYFAWGMGSHPYALKLEDRLTGAFPDVDFEVVADGQPGDIASFERFRKRMEAACTSNSLIQVMMRDGLHATPQPWHRCLSTA